jgi:hypothetical protein
MTMSAVDALARVVGERAVLACLGASAPSAVPAAVAARTMPVPCPPAALPIWLLVAGADVDAAAGTRALGPALAPLVDAGLVAERDGRLHATAAIVVLGAGVIVVDRLDAAGAGRVPWPDDSSLHLAGCLPPGAIGAWLDVGTGAAVAPLVAGARATRVRATDVNDAALARAAQGAALSGRSDIELARADLLDGDGAGAAAWDLITFNAPVPADDDAAPATTWHKAPPGAALIERFWASAGDRVAPGGEVLTHTAIAADPWALHEGRSGALTIVRYTPPGERGFAITRWRPHAPAARDLVDVRLGPGRPYLHRRDLA